MEARLAICHSHHGFLYGLRGVSRSPNIFLRKASVSASQRERRLFFVHEFHLGQPTQQLHVALHERSRTTLTWSPRATQYFPPTKHVILRGLWPGRLPSGPKGTARASSPKISGRTGPKSCKSPPGPARPMLSPRLSCIAVCGPSDCGGGGLGQRQSAKLDSARMNSKP